VKKQNIKKVYDKLGKAGSLPPLKEAEMTKVYQAEDIAYDVLIKIENGINSFEEYEDLRAEAQKAYFLCADSLIVLNALIVTAPTQQQMRSWLHKGISLAEKLFDEDYEAENYGEYWGINKTRPYVRMLVIKMDFYIEDKNWDEAILTAERIIYLNNADNNGVRDQLQMMYLLKRRYDDYMNLLEKYPDDYSAAFFYNYALYLYITAGANDPDTEEAIKEAIEFNPFVLAFLTKKRRMDDTKASYYNPQDEEGAKLYVRETKELWLSVYGVQNWLKKFL
jgi:tetratricopeptide (TPR) repeat protein